MGFKKVAIKLSSIMLVICLILSIFVVSSVSGVSADSNDRRAALIDFARRKNLASVEDLASLTYDDLRVVGLFLSNFYTPYATGISKSESEDSIKEALVNVLVNTCNFSDDVAEALVSIVWDMSMKTAQPLYISKVNDDGNVREVSSDTVVTVYHTSSSAVEFYASSLNTGGGNSLFEYDATAKGYKATTTSFLYTLTGAGAYDVYSGSYPSLQDWYNSISTYGYGLSTTGFILNDTVKNCLYWVDSSGGKHIVWDSSLGVMEYDSPQGKYRTYDKHNTFTSSTLAYALLCHNLQYSNGFAGNAIFATSDFEETMDSLTNEQKKAYGASGQQLYVDCFGNILVSYGVECYVLMPACANPYSWYSTSEGVNTAGNSINLCTLPYVAEIAEYNSTKNTENTIGLMPSETRDGTPVYYWFVELDTDDGEGDGLFKPTKNYWYVCRGKSNQATDQHVFDNTLRDLALNNILPSDYDGVDQKYPFAGNMSSYLYDADNSTSSVYMAKLNSPFTNFLVIDNLGVLGTSVGGTMDGVLNSYNIFDYEFSSNPQGISLIGDPTSKIASGALTTLNGSDASAFAVSIYLSYIYAMYDTGSNSQLGWAYNKDNFPPMSGDLSWSSILSELGTVDTNKDEMMSWIYWILHPIKGVTYFATLVTNKISATLVSWHEDMVGKSVGSNSAGAVKYTGFTGYTTIPELKDIAWTDWILDQYDSLVIFFVILISVIMLCYAMLGELTVQRALLGVLIFSICAHLPPTLINATIGVSNRVCDSLYSEKFTYWALMQHQEYVDSINKAVEEENDSLYLSAILKSQAANSDSNSTNVSVRWMTPKKENYLADVNEELSNDGIYGTVLLNNMLGTTLSGQSFMDNEDALYLYRSYTDLGSYVTYTYQNRPIDETASGYFGNITNVFVRCMGGEESLGSAATLYLQDSGVLTKAEDNGFSYKTTGGHRLRTTALASTEVAGGINNSKTKLSDSSFEVSLSTTGVGLVGLSDTLFNTTLADVNTKDIGWDVYSNFVYGLYTESPFYYFGFNYLDQMGTYCLGEPSDGTETIKGLKDLYLSGGGNYFYNLNDSASQTSAYGELRDYMDLRSLFTIVIPYLKAANDVVRLWDDLYGLWLYDDVELEYDSSGDLITDPDEVSILSGVAQNSELYYKYWHNANVARLMNMYTPWVDTMYDCDYAKSETITVAGVKYTVEDPLNPWCYCIYDNSGAVTSGRPMIFSRSEMNYWGLSESDLTSVELKLIELGDNCYEELFKLMDYYTFNDRTLVTAASMIQTFEFNKIFSQNNLIGKSYALQPQGFALKNFTYDAYLKLILAESTGEDLQTSDGGTIYERIVASSSVFTAIFMLILDIITVYIIPALKLFFLIGIFLISVLMILMATVRIEISLPSVLGKSLLLPLAKFLAVSIGVAFIVSLFMSNGNTAVTGRGGYTISLGDPAMAIIVMIVINAVTLILYFRIVRDLVKSIKKYGKATVSSVSGAVSGSLAKVAGGVALASTVASKVGGVASSIAKAPARAVSAISNSRNRRLENKANRLAIKNDKLRKKEEKANKRNKSSNSPTSNKAKKPTGGSQTSNKPRNSTKPQTGNKPRNSTKAKTGRTSRGAKPIRKSGTKPKRIKKSKK